MKPCRRTDRHTCVLGAHDHHHHGRAWAALDAVSAGARWLLTALFIAAGVLGIWALAFAWAFGEAGYR